MILRDASKYLFSGYIMYLALAACGDNSPTKSIGSGGAGGAINDAYAQDSDTCSTCSVKEPLKVITADSDPNQYERGSLDVSPGAAKVVDGPFLLTDLFNRIPFAVSLFIAKAGACASGGTDFTVLQGSQSVIGARVLIRNGETLCADAGSTSMKFSWTGFRPY